MNVFGIGLPEMAVIAAIALLVFGPKRLPELGKTLGRTLKGFQSASQGFEEQFRTALDTAPEATPPAANTLSASGAETPSSAQQPSSIEATPAEGTAANGPQAG